MAEPGIAPCRCGQPPAAFQSDTTDDYVICCRSERCDFTEIVAEETSRAAVERWARIVKASE